MKTIEKKEIINLYTIEELKEKNFKGYEYAINDEIRFFEETTLQDYFSTFNEFCNNLENLLNIKIEWNNYYNINDYATISFKNLYTENIEGVRLYGKIQTILPKIIQLVEENDCIGSREFQNRIIKDIKENPKNILKNSFLEYLGEKLTESDKFLYEQIPTEIEIFQYLKDDKQYFDINGAFFNIEEIEEYDINK